MRLEITTPDRILVERADVAALRAEDASGWFGILPGHADFLTVLVPTVLSYRTDDGAEHFTAVRGGVLSVRGGALVTVATREGFAGDDLEALEAQMAAAVEAGREDEAAARTDTARLEAAAVRAVEDYLAARH